jgi:dinuclear metal center YbgI/SA1388 family protein
MSTTIRAIVQMLSAWASPQYQESYDNAGLIVGQPGTAVKGVLTALDATEATLEEAKARGCNLVVAHHPIVFKGLKQLNGKNYVERTILKAIREDIAIFAIHTNLDNIQGGVNTHIASQLGLQQVRILAPRPNTLLKLTTFCPTSHTQAVLQALGQAGAGQIGAYKNCSFRTSGIGAFQPDDNAKPFIGQAGQLEEVAEDRLEVIFPTHLKGAVMQALRQAHPYEEVAYYLHQLENDNQEIGSGAIGQLPQPMPIADFLALLKNKMQARCIRHTALFQETVQTIALCGGTGSFLLPQAIRQGADVFVSADFKYHEFFDADQRILIADIGHYESEQFTADLLQHKLQAAFVGLPVVRTQLSTNPIQYYV